MFRIIFRFVKFVVQPQKLGVDVCLDSFQTDVGLIRRRQEAIYVFLDYHDNRKHRKRCFSMDCQFGAV